MKKKILLTHDAAGIAVKNLFTQIKNNTGELMKRTPPDEPAHAVLAQLNQLATSCLEWGEVYGHINIWGAFTPSMLDYKDVEEDYYATQD